ncbi:MAG: hypothetical protein M1820_008722 [Bogoriella megaspora]|nr:MAG: hypothetical protein M1820_008722 [Bogoriella megaspora]
MNYLTALLHGPSITKCPKVSRGITHPGKDLSPAASAGHESFAVADRPHALIVSPAELVVTLKPISILLSITPVSQKPASSIVFGPQQNNGARQTSESSDAGESQSHEPTQAPQVEHLDKDIAWLESIYNSQNLSDSAPSNELIFRTCSIEKILEARPFKINGSPSSISIGSSKCIWLPLYSEAKILLEKFIDHIDHIHHVVHCPSLMSTLNDVYDSLSHQGQVKPGQMILLLSIFASSTHSWDGHDCERGLFSTHADANAQAYIWVKATEDLLDVAHRTTRVSIEGIQGIIIVSFVVANFEGIGRRCKSLYNVALLLARELGLHCLDHPSYAQLAHTAQAELGRRVWWYLAVSDWALGARLGGTAQSIYQCHPRQMMVRKPLNIDDEELMDGMDLTERPLSEPTAMSYLLQRIRLGEISRAIIDRTPIMMGECGGPSHHVVMNVDTDLQSLLNEIPPFFSMSAEEIINTYHFDALRAAKIVGQGHMIYTTIYAQRCKLHFPYFSRGYVDSTYASSRDICLSTARRIIQSEVQLSNSKSCQRSYKLLGLLLGIFMASIVLSTDLCHNTSSLQSEEQRGEIADAFQILEDARHESITAAKFLDSLMPILRKHKVALPSHSKRQVPDKGASEMQLSTESRGSATRHASTAQQSIDYDEDTLYMPCNSAFGGNTAETVDTADVIYPAGDDLSPYFHELAQSFEQGIDGGSFDWNSIFSGLESSFV